MHDGWGKGKAAHSEAASGATLASSLSRPAGAALALWLAAAFGGIVLAGFYASLNLGDPSREHRVLMAVISTIAVAGFVLALPVICGIQGTVRAVALPSAVNLPLHLQWVVLGGTVLLLLLVARVVLASFPNSGDEYAYVMQADTYRLGRLTVPAPPQPEAFSFYRYLVKDGVWFSPYQPGWSALLAAGKSVGLPYWTVASLLGGAMLAAFWVVAGQVLSQQARTLATLSLATSAFFILNFSSFFSHGLCALALVGLAGFGQSFIRDGSAWKAIAAGACIGVMGATRTFDAVIYTLPFVIALLLASGRRMGLVWFALGGLPFAIAFGLANYGVTGNPLLLTTSWYSASEPLGAPSGDSARETIARFVLLHLWTSPATLPALGASIAWLAYRRRLSFADFILPLTILAYVFYGGDGGDQYGPRYLFAAWPLAILSIFKMVDGVLFTGRPDRWSAIAAAGVLAHISFQIGFLPSRLQREHQVIAERSEVFDDVKDAKLTNAVVLLASDHGLSRRMSRRDLIRNGLTIGDESVTFALFNAAATEHLPELFPDRTFYVYECGRLTPLVDQRPPAEMIECPAKVARS